MEICAISSYTWKKNDQLLDLNNSNLIHQLPGVGTLVIEIPMDRDEGIYQCLASNDYGSAVTVKTVLKRAGMYTPDASFSWEM